MVVVEVDVVLLVLVVLDVLLVVVLVVVVLVLVVGGVVVVVDVVDVVDVVLGDVNADVPVPAGGLVAGEAELLCTAHPAAARTRVTRVRTGSVLSMAC